MGEQNNESHTAPHTHTCNKVLPSDCFYFFEQLQLHWLRLVNFLNKNRVFEKLFG